MDARASANRNAIKVINAPVLRVGGLVRLSTCDWPGLLVATIFCQGCGWACSYCHNRHLQPAQAEEPISWEAVLSFLQSRRDLLDGVVFSGGEPTQQPALLAAAQQVRKLGFSVGLHTAGMAPERFKALLPWIDWVGFDVKAPFDDANDSANPGKYARITQVESSGANALASLRLLLASGIEYEVRTTVHPALLTLEDMFELRDQLLSLGATHYAVQHFRTPGTDSNLATVLEPQRYTLPSDYGDGFLQFHIR